MRDNCFEKRITMVLKVKLRFYLMRTFSISMKVLKVTLYIHLKNTLCHKLNTVKRAMSVVYIKLEGIDNSAHCNGSHTMGQRNSGFKRAVASLKDYLRCVED